MQHEIQRWDWKNWSEISRDVLYEILTLRQAIFVVEQNALFDMEVKTHRLLMCLGIPMTTHPLLQPCLSSAIEEPKATIGRVIVHPKHEEKVWLRANAPK